MLSPCHLIFPCGLQFSCAFACIISKHIYFYTGGYCLEYITISQPFFSNTSEKNVSVTAMTTAHPLLVDPYEVLHVEGETCRNRYTQEKTKRKSLSIMEFFRPETQSLLDLPTLNTFIK